MNGRSLVLLSVLGLIPATALAEPPKKLSKKVSTKNLKATVKFLSTMKPARNHRNVKALDKAAAHVRKKLESYGYEVREQVFEVDGKKYKNLITNVGPEGAPMLVLGAHYDVAGELPGADDNASGVAGLLEVARLIKARKPKLTHRLELVAYTLEEPPYFASKNMGSYIHAKSLKDAGVELKAMVCLEMIGYFDDKKGSQNYPMPSMKATYPDAGNFIAVVGDFASAMLVSKVKGLMKSAIKVDVQSLVAPPSMRAASFSDHRNYWAMGYRAVMINDTAFYRNMNYHKPTDTMKTLSFPAMAQVVEGVYVVVTSDKL